MMVVAHLHRQQNMPLVAVVVLVVLVVMPLEVTLLEMVVLDCRQI
jgi:hypothetical protein|tara:strand:- start:268 stop:402 length:135 start_codon:yes stop_codon:yes gene_type:complete